MREYELEDLAHLYATEGLEGEALEAFESWKASADESERAGFAELVDTIALVSLAFIPAIAPAAGSKERLLERIAAEALKPAGLPAALEVVAAMLSGDGEWIQLPVRGARLQELSARAEDGVAVFLLELAAGTEFPAHHHQGTELTYLLSGDLRVDERVLEPGDFLGAVAGSKHRHLFSETGCRALVVTALENYPRRRIKLFGRFAKVYQRARGLVRGGNP